MLASRASLVLLFLCIGGGFAAESVTEVFFSVGNDSSITELNIFNEDTQEVNVLLVVNRTVTPNALQVKFQSESRKVMRISERNDTDLLQPRLEIYGNRTVYAIRTTCVVEGVLLGKAGVQVYVRGSSKQDWQKVEKIEELQIIVKRKMRTLDTVYRVILIVMVVMMTICMGASIEINTLKEIFKKPIPPAIGFCCQFIIMPNLAVAVAMATGIKAEFGLGLLTMGCAPGGGSSNAWTVLMNGDLTLSIIMTFISNIAGLFMMPLWMFVYARLFVDYEKVKVPLDQIAINLLQLAIPCIIGLLIRWKLKKVADVLQKIVKPLTIVFLIYILGFGVYVNLFIYIVIGNYPQMIPVGALLPWCGFILGYLVAWALKQPYDRRITICLETGFQNVGIPILILLYSMPSPYGDLGGIIPVICGVMGPFPWYILSLGCCIRRRIKGRKKEEDIGEPTTEVDMVADVSSKQRALSIN